MVRIVVLLAVLGAACGDPAAHAIDAGDDAPGNAVDAAVDTLASPPSPAAYAAAPAALSFGSVVVGAVSPTVAIAITNTGGTVSAAITATLGGTGASSFAVTGTTCTAGLRPSASCTLQVQFAPTSPGAKAATLTASDGTAGVAIALSGTGITAAGLQISPSVDDFGAVPIATTSANTVTITNLGGSASGALSVTKTGAADFALGANTCTGATLAPSASCTISIAFTPSVAGTRTASLDVTGAPGGTVTASLIGTGTSGSWLRITPAPYDFGDVRLGDTSFAHQFIVTNNGPGTTGGIAFAEGGLHVGDFYVMGNSCTNATLGPGAACSLWVTFEPGYYGARSATIEVSASPGGGATSNLSGNCTQ